MPNRDQSMFFRDLFDGGKDSWEEYEAKLKLLAAHVEATALHTMKLYRYYEIVHALGRQVYNFTEKFVEGLGLEDWSKLQKKLLSSEVIRAPWK